MMKWKEKWQTSKRMIVIIGLMVLTFCFAMFQGGFVSWFVFFTVIPFLVYSFILSLVPLRFEEVSRTVRPNYIKRGDHALITVRFRNATKFPLVFLIVKETAIPEAFYQSLHRAPSKLFLVGMKREFEWTYELRNVSRGEHTLEGLSMTVTDFFGWVERTVELAGATKFIVYPKITQIKNASLHLQYEQGTTATKFSMMKDTTMATGVREYQPGDRFSWIHWKSFAKNGTLRTKEFEDRQSQKLFIYLDKSTQPDFELAVDLAASMTTSLMKANAELSFVTGGAQGVQFTNLRTELQTEKVLQYLANVKANATNPIVSYIRQESQIANGVLLIATSHLSDEVLSLLMTGSKYAKAIICFVVVTKEAMREVTQPRTIAGDNRVVYLTEEMFEQAFAEVNKP